MNKYFYKYVNNNKWIQINGEGDDPKNCKISWESSENNEDMDIIMKEEKVRSPIYGWIKLDDPEIKNNIYVQVLRISPVIRDGYKCEKYEIPKIDPLLPDPQIIMPEKKEEEIKTEKISINKSELIKLVNNNFLSLQSYNKQNLKFENEVVNDMTKWIKNSEKNLKDELKDFYSDLNY